MRPRDGVEITQAGPYLKKTHTHVALCSEVTCKRKPTEEALAVAGRIKLAEIEAKVMDLLGVCLSSLSIIYVSSPA